MRSKKILKLLNKALKNNHLYNEDELNYMKQQLQVLKEEVSKIEVKNYKGFGKKYETH